MAPFSIEGVTAGAYTATVSLDGFRSVSQSVQMSAGGAATLSFEVRPAYHATVVVTAERVEENVMEVPMTISAFDSALLEELVIQERTDLQNLVPGLQFGDEIEQQGQGTSMRGIGTRNAQYDQADYAVATYVDGAYTLGVYGTTPGGGFDLERVEVARGPQDTLNGRNSIAGAINLVTKGPTDDWDAELMGEITDVSQQRLNAAVGGPLGDGPFSFRLTGGNHTGDGRQKNVGDGGDHDAPDQMSTRRRSEPKPTGSPSGRAGPMWRTAERRGVSCSFRMSTGRSPATPGTATTCGNAESGPRSELWQRSPGMELPGRGEEQGGVQLSRLE